MGSVAVVTDTCHYLPRELVAARGIHEVSLYVHWDGREDREAELPDFDAYYEHLRTPSDLPTTSQPSIGDFLAVYEPLLARGHARSSRSTSPGACPGTFASAEQAREQLGGRGGERVHVIDSASACGGAGPGRARRARRGRAAAPSARGGRRARARRRASALKMWFAIDTLEYLRRGGRIGAAQAWLGSALKIKPILTVEAEITPVERVRTSRPRVRADGRLPAARATTTAPTPGSSSTSRRPTQPQRLAERGPRDLRLRPLFVSEIGPVIGTHVGPGLLGVGGIPSSFLA